MANRSAFCVILLGVFIGKVYCQQQLSLQQALDLTKENYPSIKSKAAAKIASEQEVTLSRSAYVPNLIVQGQITDATANQVRGTFFPNEGMAIPVSGGIRTNGSNTSQMTWSSFATSFVNWKVFSFGKVKSNIDLAKSEVKKSQSDFDNEVFQQKIKVCDAYILSIELEGIVKAQKANLDRMLALKNVTVAYAKSGIKSGVDSSLVNAEYSKAYLNFLETKRMSDEQKINLSELMGMPGATRYKLDTNVYITKTPQAMPSVTQIASNPLLTYYQSLIDYNRNKIKALKRAELPSISIIGATFGRGSGIANALNSNGDYVYNNSFSSSVGFRAVDYMVGLSTIWNITGSYRNQIEGKKQFYFTKEIEELYNEQKLRLEGELEKSNLRYSSSMEAAVQAPVQLRSATDAYYQSKARYDSGLNTIIELTQTYAILNRSEVDLTVAYGNTWRSLLFIAAASGDLNYFLNNIK